MWPFQPLNYGFLAPLYKVQMLDFLEPQCHLACATSGVSCKLEYLVCTSAQTTCYIYILTYMYIIYIIHVCIYMYTSAYQPVFIRLTQVLPLIFFWHQGGGLDGSYEVASSTRSKRLKLSNSMWGAVENLWEFWFMPNCQNQKKNLKENIWLINMDIVWLTYVSTWWMHTNKTGIIAQAFYMDWHMRSTDIV